MTWAYGVDQSVDQGMGWVWVCRGVDGEEGGDVVDGIGERVEGEKLRNGKRLKLVDRVVVCGGSWV